MGKQSGGFGKCKYAPDGKVKQTAVANRERAFLAARVHVGVGVFIILGFVVFFNVLSVLFGVLVVFFRVGIIGTACFRHTVVASRGGFFATGRNQVVAPGTFRGTGD